MLPNHEAYEILQRALQRLREYRNWDRLQTALGQFMMELLEADGAAVVVRGTSIPPHLIVRLITPDREEKTFRIQAQGNVASWVLATGQVAQVEDVYLDDRYGNEFPHGLGVEVRSLLAAPLIARGETFGVLEALWEAPKAYREEDASRLLALADGVAPLASYALDLWRAQERVEELEALIEAAGRVSSTLELDALLLTIIQLAQQMTRAEASSLLLLEPATGELVFHIALGEKGEEVRKFRLKVGEGIAGWVVEHGEPLLVPNAQEDPRFRRDISEQIEFPTRSILCVPLKVGPKTIGAIEVINSIGRESFDEHDLRRLSMLAQQAALAVQNAQQFESLRQSLEQVQGSA